MNDIMFTAASIAVIAAVTWICRAIPYIIFGGKREIPPVITYLGKVLPAAIMIILVIYCLRNVEFFNYSESLPTIISVAAVVLLQWKKENTILTIAAGTVLYMVLIRVM
ncbi:MAG: AzlD domain-containing protein [Clostridiales bacterium]|nr:AzlD domain-containing protein [Clostridiales bacterium]